MRILTWNVNGLRPAVQRAVSLAKLLETLNADIVCLQETKLRRSELERELAVVDGWESFWSLSKAKTGYAGVATFCRQPVLPLSAEEGLTAPLQAAAPSALSDALWGEEAAAAGGVEAERLTLEQLQSLDAEGRALVTDHGAFVLVNLYGPAITTATLEDRQRRAERFHFKLAFYKVLEHRLRSWLAAGRAVLLVGDFNISPAPLDSCDPGPPAGFWARPDRAWLNALLDQGVLVDAFRLFHPGRSAAFTCWNTATGARLNNWGTRIDLVLAAGPAPKGLCGEQGGGGGGSGAGPASSAEPGGGGGGGSGSCSGPGRFSSLIAACDIWPEHEGSDHAPVWCDVSIPLAAMPAGHAPPPGAGSRLFPGRQGSIRSWLQQPGQQRAAGQEAPQAGGAWASGASRPGSQEPPVAAGAGAGAGGRPAAQPAGGSGSQGSRSGGAAARPTGHGGKRKQPGRGGGGNSSKGQRSLLGFVRKQQAPAAADSGGEGAGELAATGSPNRSAAGSEPQLLADELRVGGSPAERQGLTASSSVQAPQQPLQPQSQPSLPRAADERQPQQGSGQLCLPASHPLQSLTLQQQEQQQPGQPPPSQQQQQQQQAVVAWARIAKAMEPPCCSHGEPAVVRTTKKRGPNLGRKFFVCARAAGAPPVGRCDFFMWHEVWLAKRKAGGAAARGATPV